MRRYAERAVTIEAHPALATQLLGRVEGVHVVHGAAFDEPGEIQLHMPVA
jgi:hypothetical protein